MASIALVASGLALGIASVAAGHAHPGWWFAGESTAAAALELAAGVALVGAGVAAWRRRPASGFGPLLALAGLAWFLPEWNNPEAGGSLSFTAGLALGATAPAVIAHAALAYPGGRLRSRAERAVVGLAYLGSLGLAGLLPALLSDPRAGGCAECPANLLRLSADGSLAEDVQRVGLALAPVWVALVIVLAAWRTARGSVAQRRLRLPVLVPAGAFLAAVAVDSGHSVDRGFLSNDSTDLTLWVAQGIALCLLAAGATAEWLRARRTRSALASLVVELERSPAPGGLRAALALRLDDASLELLHRVPDGGLVDAGGRHWTPAPDQELTPLTSGGRELALLAHRPGLFDDPTLAEQVASAARLALDNERLQAELRAQLESLRASRARIVDAGDQERRRLERDLHDGAQQRLVALSIGLTIAQQSGDAQGLERAQREVKALLAELRELAHGIYPVALADEGLAAALEALAEDAPVPLRFESPLPDERLDPPVETAAYLVVREIARDGRRGWAAVEAAREDGRFVLRVAADGGAPAELVHLEDRVGAVGGLLRCEEPGDGVTRLRAELPCA